MHWGGNAVLNGCPLTRQSCITPGFGIYLNSSISESSKTFCANLAFQEKNVGCEFIPQKAERRLLLLTSIVAVAAQC